jgi:tetratricopeptide (TPR) repeat protein
LFDECVQDFPSDIVVLNARASALADFGRLDESLASFDSLVRSPLPDPVSLAGRATVLREMGRLDDAWRQIKEAVSIFPNELVVGYIRGDIERELGEFEEALQSFQRLKARFPVSPIPLLGRARVMREMGRLNEARAEFETISSSFPLDPSGPIGLADIDKRRGQLSAAVDGYKALRVRFPRNPWIRNSLASVLSAAGLFQEAELLLPDAHPASRSDWGAYHIRGILRLKTGEREAAAAIFRRGMDESPWAREKALFRTSLALADLQGSNFSEVSDRLAGNLPVTIAPVAAVIRFHAAMAMGRKYEVDSAYEAARGAARTPVLAKLLDITVDFLTSPAPSSSSTKTFFQLECDALLLAA